MFKKALSIIFCIYGYLSKCVEAGVHGCGGVLPSDLLPCPKKPMATARLTATCDSESATCVPWNFRP